MLRAIGRFSLDPNRVADVLLEALEARCAAARERAPPPNGAEPCPEDLLPLFSGRLLPRASLAHLLGFRFAHFARGEALEPPPADAPAAAVGEEHKKRAAAKPSPGVAAPALPAPPPAAPPPAALYAAAAWLVASG